MSILIGPKPVDLDAVDVPAYIKKTYEDADYVPTTEDDPLEVTDLLFPGVTDIGALRMSMFRVAVFTGYAAPMRLAEFVREYKNFDNTKGVVLLTGINIITDSHDNFNLFYMDTNPEDDYNKELKARLTGHWQNGFKK